MAQKKVHELTHESACISAQGAETTLRDGDRVHTRKPEGRDRPAPGECAAARARARATWMRARALQRVLLRRGRVMNEGGASRCFSCCRRSSSRPSQALARRAKAPARCLTRFSPPHGSAYAVSHSALPRRCAPPPWPRVSSLSLHPSPLSMLLSVPRPLSICLWLYRSVSLRAVLPLCASILPVCVCVFVSVCLCLFQCAEHVYVLFVAACMPAAVARLRV